MQSEYDVFYSCSPPSDTRLGKSFNRPTVYQRPNQRPSQRKKQSDILETMKESYFDSELPLFEPLLSTVIKNEDRIYKTRLYMLLDRKQIKTIHQKTSCSMDTSAALILLIQKKKWVRYLINLYIWFNIILRFGYIGFSIYYVVVKWDDLHDENKLGEFNYWIFGSLFGIRVLFIMIIYKLLSIGKRTKDLRIKIVYETYEAWFNDTYKERDLLIQECDSMIVRNGQDELKLRELQQKLKGLNRWLFLLKTYIIWMPPEFQYIFLKQTSNGFFQVQNFIMKNLEIFFFTPQMMYFLTKYDKAQFDSFWIENPFELWNYILGADVALFIILTIILVIVGNRKNSVSTIQKRRQ